MASVIGAGFKLSNFGLWAGERCSRYLVRSLRENTESNGARVLPTQSEGTRAAVPNTCRRGDDIGLLNNWSGRNISHSAHPSG